MVTPWVERAKGYCSYDGSGLCPPSGICATGVHCPVHCPVSVKGIYTATGCSNRGREGRSEKQVVGRLIIHLHAWPGLYIIPFLTQTFVHILPPNGFGRPQTVGCTGLHGLVALAIQAAAPFLPGGSVWVFLPALGVLFASLPCKQQQAVQRYRYASNSREVSVCKLQPRSRTGQKSISCGKVSAAESPAQAAQEHRRLPRRPPVSRQM